MLTLQDIEQIKRDAEKTTRRRFEDAAEEGAFVPTPTPTQDLIEDDTADAEKPKRGRPPKEDKEEQ